MKLHFPPALLSTFALAGLLGGCATSQIARSDPAAPRQPAAAITMAAKPVTPATSAPTTPPPALPAPASPPELTSSLNPEVTALVVQLTEMEHTDALAHDVVDTTGFPEAIASLAPGAPAPKIEKIDQRSQPPPRGLTADGDSIGLIERDWTGLVLVPINKSLSKAYTSAVRLLKVEAHPLQDGRVRVWIRMKNIGQKQLPSEIACAFTMRGDTKPMSPNFYQLEVPSREYRDVFFVSPAGELVTYTVLVRSNQINYRISGR